MIDSDVVLMGVNQLNENYARARTFFRQADHPLPLVLGLVPYGGTCIRSLSKNFILTGRWLVAVLLGCNFKYFVWT
jgi:hypothetical protein